MYLQPHVGGARGPTAWQSLYSERSNLSIYISAFIHITTITVALTAVPVASLTESVSVQ